MLVTLLTTFNKRNLKALHSSHYSIGQTLRSYILTLELKSHYASLFVDVLFCSNINLPSNYRY